MIEVVKLLGEILFIAYIIHFIKSDGELDCKLERLFDDTKSIIIEIVKGILL